MGLQSAYFSMLQTPATLQVKFEAQLLGEFRKKHTHSFIKDFK